MTQREKAEELRRLHAAPEPLVLVNAWDAVSARVVADAGARAIATASWSIAAARGYEDGEQIPLDEMLDSVRVVARAVELPVTADLERGFGDAGATVARAIEAGAVGCNLEDSTGSGGLVPVEAHVAAVAAARAAGEAAGVPVVINARTDVFLEGLEFDEAVERARAYLGRGRRRRVRARRERRGDVGAARDQDPRADQRVRRGGWAEAGGAWRGSGFRA